MQPPSPRSSLLRLGLLGVGVVMLSGCGSCSGDDGGGGGPGGSHGEVPVGTVEGVVLLQEGAEIPSYPPEAMGVGPGRPAPPEGCPPPRLSDRQPVRLVDGGRLAGVLVSATEFRRAPEHAPTQRELVIRDCRLTPMLIVANRGDTLVIRNETDYPYLPQVGNSPFMQAVMQGQEHSVPLPEGGVTPVTCGFAAPCGRADVVVLYQPVFTVTGDDGTFRMTNVPAGQEVQIHAWHPLFVDGMARVTVAEGGTEHVEITLHPPPRPPEPPQAPESPPPGPAEDNPDNVPF